MNNWRTSEIEISRILAAVDQAYDSCKKYQDKGIIRDDCFVMKEETSFCTQYFAPDRLIYKRKNSSEKETTYDIDGNSCRIIREDPKLNKPTKIPFTNTVIDWNKLNPEYVLSGAGGVTFSISDYTLPLLIRNGNRGNWTKSKNFRLIGKKMVKSTECYVIQDVSNPTLICIRTDDFIIKRIEQGPEYIERFTFSACEMLARFLATIDGSKSELLDAHNASYQERVCDFFQVNVDY